MANVSGSAKSSMREVSIDTRVPSFPGVYGAVAIPAKKGPINEATLVTGDSQFLKRYTANEKIEVGMDNSYFSAMNFLQQSNKLWVNRVAVNALYSILLYTSGRAELPVINLRDEIGVDTNSDTIGVTASFNKYLNTGDVVRFTTDDTLPTPLSIDTDYYVIKKDNGTIQVADSYENATKVKKAVTVDITTETFTVGTPTQFSVNVSSNADRVTAISHGLSSGDKIRLTSTPTAPVTFTVTYTVDNSLINFATTHKLVDNQLITLSSGGTLPSGLTTATNYYVTVVSSTSIRVSNTSGGSFVTFTSNGTGTHVVDAGILPAPLNAKTFTYSSAMGQTNITVTSHGFVDGQQVRLSTTGALPTASPIFNTSTFYYVNVVNANTITLSLTQGGLPIVFDGTSGSGVQTVHPEIYYAIVLNSNTLSIEPVVGSGAVTFTGNGFGVHYITRPHNLSNATPIQFTATSNTQKFTTNYAVSNKTFISPNHGLTNDMVVFLNNDKQTATTTSNDLPSGLDVNTRYYVVNATTNTFELSSTFGTITSVTFSDDGTGNNYVNTGILPNASGGALDFNTTYYIVNSGFDTFQVSTTSGGSAKNLSDFGSGVLQFETGFIDLMSSYTGTSYINREVFSMSVKSTVFTSSTNNRLLLDTKVVSTLDTGTPVRFTSKGILPSPLLTNNTYYVIKYPIQAPEIQLQSYHTNATTIKLATSLDNALAYSPSNDTSLTLSLDGTGIHSMHFNRGMSEDIGGYEIGNIVDNFVINQDSLNETVIVSEKFGERLKTGDKVRFSTNVGGRLPLPLLPNTDYYVIKQSDTEFKLATTRANAIADVPIVLDLTDNVSFSLTNSTTSNGYAVNPSTDIITLPTSLTNFGSQLTTGTPVSVSVVTTTSAPTVNVLSASDKLPRPLKPNTIYYWIRIDDNHFKLALNPNDAVLGISVDLTDIGSGDEMLISLEGTNKITFTPSVVDPTAFTLGSDDLFIFYSANEGAWGNDVFIRLEDYRHKEADAFLLKVFKRNNLNIPVETFVCSRKVKKDGRGQNIYIQDVLESSAYIRCFDNTLIDEDVFPTMSMATVSNPNVRSLTGGHDGDTVTEGKMILGLNQFKNTERLPITVLMDGGWSFPSFQRELDAIAQSRQDCVAILSTPFDKEASSDYLNAIVDYRNLDLNLNSSYSALYSPSPLVYDKFNDRRVFVSPDGFIGALISATAANYELWFPVAGFKRGILNVLDVRRKFDSGEMDYLYDNGINPIRFAPGKGIVVWGQKTLLSRPSVLDRLNARLLLIVIEPAIKSVLEDNFIFEINDESTRGLAKAIVESYLRGIQARRGLTDFRVIADDSNNSLDDVDNHLLNIWIFIKPVSSLEYVSTTMAVTPNSLSFSVVEGLIT